MIAIGVDAGGTSTVAALAHDGGFVREASGPAANPSSLGVDGSAAAIIAAIRGVAVADEPDAIHAGVAGAGRASIARALEARIAEAFPSARVSVGDDAQIALRGAIPEGPGVVAIAGTGSIAYAEHGDQRVRIGGFGYLLGDEGSAFALGMGAVKNYARALDGRAPREETCELVARALEAPDRETLLAAIYDARLVPTRIAALAPSIIAFAGKGNRTSTKLVQEAAKDFGELVRAAIKGAGLADASPTVALAGGLFAENSLFTFLVETRLNGDTPGITIVRDGEAPVRGALRIALSPVVA
jgi:N-acetylglucosamine kinase-like BadF-type ATPase